MGEGESLRVKTLKWKN